MTPLFCCGFECGLLRPVAEAPTGVPHWQRQSGVGTAAIDTTTVNNGDRSLQIVSSGVQGWCTHPITSTNIGVLRAYFYHDETDDPANLVFLGFFTATSVTVGLARLNGGQYVLAWQVAGGTINAGTNFGTLTTGWHCVDLRVNTSANPWVINGQIDGVAMTTYSPAEGATTFANISLGWIPTRTATFYYDDVVYSATTGDYPIGTGRVLHFVPTADGTHNIAGANDYERNGSGVDILNSTTDAYQLIDDVPMNISVSDYINMVAPTANSYTEHIFGPAPGVSTPSDAPRAVEVIASIHQAGTGTGNMQINLVDNGTEGIVYNASGVAGVTTIIHKTAQFSDPPSAATSWVMGGGGNGDFSALRIRFDATGTADANPDQFLDSIMIEAEFPLATPTTFTIKDIICGGMVIPFDRP